ncbi:MAG: hypothetical protein IE916_00025 [Epsilonproteobacteria bacterium]|nr:hypothetical protein [Campylobacterota bacterium]
MPSKNENIVVIEEKTLEKIEKIPNKKLLKKAKDILEAGKDAAEKGKDTFVITTVKKG